MFYICIKKNQLGEDIARSLDPEQQCLGIITNTKIQNIKKVNILMKIIYLYEHEFDFHYIF